MDQKTSGKAKPQAGGRDYRETVFLPQTDFPMKAGLPQKEPEILKRWQGLDLYRRQRRTAAGRDKFVLHDGPPYANGHLHIGHALNKILKDVVVRSQQMMGRDSNYVPGWDCHGLPIEWKIEEEYRAKGKDKDQVPVVRFRKECRAFAEHWIGVQSEEFQRLGVDGDWSNPYTTMSPAAEAQIARELMAFAMTGQLYRGAKPVMWSVVEKTALAEAEVEYQDFVSDTVWVKFPVTATASGRGEQLADAAVVIWTTTPWTIPGNRAICFSPTMRYGLYEVTDAPAGSWAKPGDRLILADKLAAETMQAARVGAFERRADVDPSTIVHCAHPLRAMDYAFDVPLFAGGHVTDDAGTGFVHTAPGHGADDFDIWTANETALKRRGIDTAIPFTVDAGGFFTKDAPGFTGRRVLTDKGEKGDANEAVIQALIAAGALIARGRLKHQYPHSWRSKKPIIFRNTPQWFIAMGDERGAEGLRAKALKAIDEVRWVPPSGRNRLYGIIEARPDWVISRQRAWGVPITVFVHRESGEVIPNPKFRHAAELIRRIGDAFEAEGSDAWFAEGARERLLDGLVEDCSRWEKIDDILDVWFESGSTHSFVVERREDLKPRRIRDGGPDQVMYLEGSDQHRGWFHSSLLESCGTRGRAPYDVVLTHGFVMDEHGHKMSKSLGNVVVPQEVIRQSGADILRLWVMAADYGDDLRIGPEILKSNVESYRKLRNTMRYLLGNLAGFDADERIAPAEMPELERLMLHHLAALDEVVRKGYDAFDFNRVFTRLFNFCTNDLSAFYFDIRKDALYCDPRSSARRRACRSVLDHLLRTLTIWLAPMLPFTMEEVWQSRFLAEQGSVHLEAFPAIPAAWRDAALAERWDKVRELRRVVTGALEIERQAKRRIGSSLEAAPVVHVADPAYLEALDGLDLAEIAITSAATLVPGEGPADAFRLDDVPGVAVVAELARGQKCARSWKVLPEVGSVPGFPDLTPRDAEAVREWDARHGRA